MTVEDEFEAAKTVYHDAARRLETAILAVVTEAVRERFPSATAVHAYGEMNDDYSLVLRIRSIVAGDDVLFDVDHPTDDDDIGWADELDSEYLTWLIELHEDDYRGENVILVAETVTA